VPNFCRHNRFVERCPICARERAQTQATSAPGGTRSGTAAKPSTRRSARRSGSQSSDALRVRREQRSLQDGYSCELLPGLGSSQDAARLAEEIAFATGRLKLLACAPPGLYGQLRELAGGDLERATWECFLAVYLSPLQGDEPFESIVSALKGSGAPGELPDLAGLELGPRSSHDPARGAATLLAYGQWAGTSQAEALRGDPSWTPERRFERIFERLALPGFGRMGRYELLVTLGRLGLYELRAEDLRLGAGRGGAGDDLTLAGAKRVFAIGDPLLLERRAGALAQALEVPVEALDVGLANWQAEQRATLGVPEQTVDEGVRERAGAVLGL